MRDLTAEEQARAWVAGTRYLTPAEIKSLVLTLVEEIARLKNALDDNFGGH